MKYLVAFSGQDEAEATRNILSQVFSNSFAFGHNVSGKGAFGKKGFQLFQLYIIQYLVSYLDIQLFNLVKLTLVLSSHKTFEEKRKIKISVGC